MPPRRNSPKTVKALDVSALDECNQDGKNEENNAAIEKLGGMSGLEAKLETSLAQGLTIKSRADVEKRKKRFGANEFPSPEPESWLSMFLESFEDTTNQVLMVAAVVSLAIGIADDYKKKQLGWGSKGWIEGAAILFAVMIVAVVTATNNYNKEQQFRKLNDVKDDVDVVVVRNGEVQHVNIKDLVVGDILKLEAGDKVPADGLLFSGSDVTTNESAVTGESEDVKKSPGHDSDRFLISGSTLSSGTAKALVIATGANSRWGKVKSKLEKDSPDTPLQEKLTVLADQIGYFGMGAAACTFGAMMYMWWAHPESREGSLTETLVEAFIMAVTIVVVAVPEGLPLAVTLSLAYSTQKMMDDNNLIRVLAACETMGNATNICSDKTGTLTENRMTVVECWLGDVFHKKELPTSQDVPAAIREVLIRGLSCNSTANLISDHDGKIEVSGNKTEGALLLMIRDLFDADYTPVRATHFDSDRGDRLFTFSSKRKCMSVLLLGGEDDAVDGGAESDHSDGGKKKIKAPTPAKKVTAVAAAAGGSSKKVVAKEVPSPTVADAKQRSRARSNSGSAGNALNSAAMLYTKGASEAILQKCTHYITATGDVAVIGDKKRDGLEKCIAEMAKRSLRTVAAAHKPFNKLSALSGSETAEELETGLVLDGLFGIKDPLRPDVKAAIAKCQAAGIFVRMVTGDNIDTARAIASECGILTEGGTCMEGPAFRQLTPAQLDKLLPTLQVLARSSPDDKHALVTRLNGNKEHLPQNQQEWEALHPGRNWAKERDKLLPGYAEEWAAARAGKGSAVCSEVVGVTGDGTNDGPALKAADVGLSMGLSGTDVAKEASDIVILDDKFSSIVKAVEWGRSVFDNIRKFLQFQLTVNVVALTITLAAAIARKEPPLNAVMMLWVNLIMDTMGALALGTETPGPQLLDRRPLRRDASLISLPMIRNIAVQSLFQIALLAYLLLLSHIDFGIDLGSPQGKEKHNTLIFNTFVLCQVFNEFNARSIDDNMDVFRGLHKNATFLAIIAFTLAAQFGIVQYGGDFVKTVPLTADEWWRCGLMAALSLPVGGLMRMIPVKESTADFANLPPILAGRKNQGSDKAKENLKNDEGVAVTFVVWGALAVAIPALCFQEFRHEWGAHLAKFLAQRA